MLTYFAILSLCALLVVSTGANNVDAFATLRRRQLLSTTTSSTSCTTLGTQVQTCATNNGLDSSSAMSSSCGSCLSAVASSQTQIPACADAQTLFCDTLINCKASCSNFPCLSETVAYASCVLTSTIGNGCTVSCGTSSGTTTTSSGSTNTTTNGTNTATSKGNGGVTTATTGSATGSKSASYNNPLPSFGYYLAAMFLVAML
jgi:hypothetical protein